MLASFSEMPLPTVYKQDRRSKAKSQVTTAPDPTPAEDLPALKGQINVLAHWVAEVVTYLSLVRDDENFQGAMSDEEYRSLGDLTECGKRLAEDVLYPGVARNEALNLPAHRSPYRWMHWQTPGTLPDSDTTVMVALDPEFHDEPVWLGYHDGLDWMDIDGNVLVSVLGWAELPKGVQR